MYIGTDECLLFPNVTNSLAFLMVIISMVLIDDISSRVSSRKNGKSLVRFSGSYDLLVKFR